MIPQFTNSVFVIRPTNLDFNEETASDNILMKSPQKDPKNKGLSPKEIHEKNNDKGKRMHLSYILNLRSAGIQVIEFEQENPIAYDSMWPDWFTTHRSENIPEGVFIVYPMRNPSRRLERNENIIKKIKELYNNCIDLSSLENEQIFLEGKGAVIFDNANFKLYCNLSERSHLKGLMALKQELDKISKYPWTLINFQAFSLDSKLIYHTDCMFQILDKHAIVCLESLKENDRKMLIDELTNPSKNRTKTYEIIDISFHEMLSMCSNVMNLKNSQNENVIAMSAKAFTNYSEKNVQILSKNYKLLITNINLLENVGGGSARCLLAEKY